jgi:hypothetical protein
MNPENLYLIFFQEVCRGAYFAQPDAHSDCQYNDPIKPWTLQAGNSERYVLPAYDSIYIREEHR